MFSVVWLAQKYFSTVMKTNTKLVIKLIHPQIPPPKFLKKKKKKKKKKIEKENGRWSWHGPG
jgi:hypothetical protein